MDEADDDRGWWTKVFGFVHGSNHLCQDYEGNRASKWWLSRTPLVGSPEDFEGTMNYLERPSLDDKEC